MTILSSEEEFRYNRQIMLRQFDFDAQELLKKAAVLVIGVGGLGCTAAQYLAAAGVGQLTLVDDDKVELSNLHRQVLHNDSRIGMAKVDSASIALSRLNPHLAITAINDRLNDQALLDLIKSHQVVLDCSDNLATRNQLNQLCFNNKTPLVSGAAIRFEGQIAVFTYKENTPCYQCLSSLFAEQRLSCSEAGILSPVVGIIGSVQALECIKLLTNLHHTTQTKIQFFDALSSRWQDFLLTKNATCIICNH